MKFRSLFFALATIAVPTLALSQDLYRLSFSGTARFLNGQDRLITRRLTAQDLMARCVGTNALGTNPGYELVYNATEDAVQVANLTNGAIACDVLQFQSGVSNVDRRRLERLAFVFVPELNNAVGTAIITERVNQRSRRVDIRGQAHFALASLAPNSTASNGSTNDNSGTPNFNPIGGGTNVSVGSPPVPGTAITSTNPAGVTVPSTPVTVPVLPPIPGTVTTPTNRGATIGGTNVSVGAPPAPGTSITSTNPVGVSVPSIPVTVPSTGASGTSTNTFVPGTNTVSSPLITPPITIPDTTTSIVTNQLTQFAQQLAFNGNFINVVICNGTFSTGRRFVPLSPSP